MVRNGFRENDCSRHADIVVVVNPDDAPFLEELILDSFGNVLPAGALMMLCVLDHYFERLIQP